MVPFVIVRLLIAAIVVIAGPYIILATHPPHGSVFLSPIGGLLLVIGALLYLGSLRDLVRIGRADAPTTLVARGTYGLVRNPMYASLVLMLLGEGVLFGSWRVLGAAVTLWIGLHFLVILYEERTLARQFGPLYERYCAEVPRWIPRLAPRGH